MDKGGTMTDTIQYRQVVGLEYTFGLGEMKINMEGADDNYYSKLDEVEIDPKTVDLSRFELNKNAVKMRFSTPVMCDIHGGEHYSLMKIGAKFEGKDKNLFIERIDGLASRLRSPNDEHSDTESE